MREIQRLKDKNGRETTKEVKQLKKEVLERNLAIRDLEKDLAMKTEQLGQAGNRGKDELNQEVKQLRDQKQELEKKYRNTQKLLDEYMRKLKEQVSVLAIKAFVWHYTLSHLEIDRDVSAYSGGRRLSSRAQLVCFLTRSKRNTVIDASCSVYCWARSVTSRSFWI